MGCKIAIFFLVVVASTAINALGGLNIDPDCVNGFPNYRFYPYDCRKYLGCLSGETKIYSCPTGLYWNEEIKACDVEEKTDCSHIIPYPVPDCRTATERYYYYPYDCAKFWECYENKAYLLNCPADSLWNDGIKECDDHDKVDCSGIIPYPPTPTSPRPTTPKPTTPKPTTPKPTTPKPTTPKPTTPKPTTPKPTTPKPTTPKPTTPKPTTPKPTTPKPTTPKPTTPKPTTPKPTTRKPTTPKPTTRKPTTPKPTTPKPTHPPYTTPKIECTAAREYYPYPYDCQKYYECSNGKPALMHCPGVLEWNDKIKTCDYPEHVDCSHIIPTGFGQGLPMTTPIPRV